MMWAITIEIQTQLALVGLSCGGPEDKTPVAVPLFNLRVRFDELSMELFNSLGCLLV